MAADCTHAISAMAADAIGSLPDPVGQVVDHRPAPSSLEVSRVRGPLGVILMIFEVRLNVTAEAAAHCRRALALMPTAIAVTDADWDEEYLDLVLGVTVVERVNEAIQHINAHETRHYNAIITIHNETAAQFLAEVDSAFVLWNAPTRLADGGEYGLGAEIGISSDMLHARGPMGAQELTCATWVVVGKGHVRP